MTLYARTFPGSDAMREARPEEAVAFLATLPDPGPVVGDLVTAMCAEAFQRGQHDEAVYLLGLATSVGSLAELQAALRRRIAREWP